MKHVYDEGMRDVGSPHMPSVSSAELLRQFGRYRDTAQREPVTITSRGRRSLVLISAEEYDRLKRRDRQVLRVEDLDTDMLKALESAEVPEEHKHLDTLITDWKP
jgi:prevent-host-death family protein